MLVAVLYMEWSGHDMQGTTVVDAGLIRVAISRVRVRPVSSRKLD